MIGSRAVGVEAGRDEQPRRGEAGHERGEHVVDGRPGRRRRWRPAGSGKFTVVPRPVAVAASRCGRRCPGRAATRGTTRTARAGRRRRCPACRCRGGRRSRRSAPARPAPASAAAATATLLRRQKPIARVGVAWWPGGRTAQNAAVAVPVVEAPRPRSTRRRRRARPRPTTPWRTWCRRRAGRRPAAQNARWRRGRPRGGPARSPRGVAGARLERARGRRPTPAYRAPASTASRRAGRSGCPWPVW